jgi:hypothetical protein
VKYNDEKKIQNKSNGVYIKDLKKTNYSKSQDLTSRISRKQLK